MLIDDVRIFMGDPYVLNEHITIRQPTLREIIDYGEREYFSLISILTAFPSDMKSILWDIGKDYTQMSDFDMFIPFAQILPQERTEILFGDLDLSKLICTFNDVGEVTLVGENGLIIDWNIHRMMVDFIVKSNMIVRQRENPGNEQTKMALIEWDREDREIAANKPYRSQLLSLISAMVNHPGFKYDHKSVQSLTMYQIRDAAHRVQMIDGANALLVGLYANPYADGSKIDKSHLDWLKDI